MFLFFLNGKQKFELKTEGGGMFGNAATWLAVRLPLGGDLESRVSAHKQWGDFEGPSSDRYMHVIIVTH